MRPKLNLDRFIPNRSAMDFDYARGMLTQQHGRSHCPDNAYIQKLAEELGVNRTRILAFRDKPKPPRAFPLEEELDWVAKPTRRRYIPPAKPDRALDAPGLADDDHRNLLDWGSSNVVAIALESQVFLRNASSGVISQLVPCEDDEITNVSWAPDGCRIAVGLFDDDQMQLWDTSCNKKLISFSGCPHRSHVSALAWKDNHIVTTGGSCCIVNTDLRVRPAVSVVQRYRGHKGAVRGLKWSPSGQHLASGGNDNLVHIWDRRSVASSNSLAPWLHRLEDHTDAVKALAWCPFQDNLLASGGGDQDRCIKFWNTRTAACLNSVDTGSEVCALLWNNNQRELLSSHGLTHNQQLIQNQITQNQLTLWNYPSMDKITELTGHTSRVLYMSQSPDGCTVASAAGGDDETLKFWNVFGDPKMAKAARKSNPEPFARFNRIR